MTEKWGTLGEHPGAEEQYKAFIPPKSHFNMQNRIYMVLKSYLQLVFFPLLCFSTNRCIQLFLFENKGFNKKR